MIGDIVFFLALKTAGPSAISLSLAERDVIEGWLSGTTVTTLYYLIQKSLKRKSADKHVNNLLKIFHIAPVNRAVLQDAIDSMFTDYEDSVLYQSAKHRRLDAILTRNQKYLKTVLCRFIVQMNC